LLFAYLPALVYRIRVEEGLLVGGPGDEHSRYQARTWRLLPFCFWLPAKKCALRHVQRPWKREY
jgi:hypothetical protein